MKAFCRAAMANQTAAKDKPHQESSRSLRADVRTE